MKRCKGLIQSGFSLIELMIVVAIIGVLVSLVLPRIHMFTAKAKQSEAKTSLGALNTLHQAYFTEYNAYGADSSALGWSDPVGGRYSLSTGVSGIGTAVSGSTGICPSQANPDTWTMTATRLFSNTIALSVTCP